MNIENEEHTVDATDQSSESEDNRKSENMKKSSKGRGTYKKIPLDTRIRIIDGISNGKTLKEVSEYERIAKTTINSIMKKYSQGFMTASPRGGIRNLKVTDEIKNFILFSVDEDCTMSLRKICLLVKERFAISISQMTVHNTLKALHYTLKCIRKVPEKRLATSNVELRKIYGDEFLIIEENFSTTKIIFIDETGFNVSMRVTKGRSLVGTTPIVMVPNLRSKNISVCCAMSRNEMLFSKVSHKSYNALKFEEFITSLCDILSMKNLDKCIFIMDNVAFHKCSSIRNVIENMGHVVNYLPPYSPSLNPIEKAFQKWKNYVKRENCVSQEMLEYAMNTGFSQILPEDCDSFYRDMKKNVRLAIERKLLE